MRIALLIEYDGTAYCGWQTQKNGVSIQETIENVYFELTGERIKLTASGRTDSGVHALGQVAHFDTNLNRPAESFKFLLNTKLPKDIYILKSFSVGDDFNARYSAKRKTYQYRMYQSNDSYPLKNRYSVNIMPGVDIEKMKQGAKMLVGEKDFKCFLASGSAVKTTVRTIYSCEITAENCEIVLTITGNGFLYNMVRSIVGTLLKIGYGKMTIQDLEVALNTGDRNLIGKTMPPQGLTLVRVEYV